MAPYLLRRLLYLAVTMLVIVSLTFVIMHAIPGDPFLSERKVSAAARANLMARYGLDKPVHEQYVIYVRNVLSGDLGTSMYYVQRNVTDLIRDGFPVSARLGLAALAYSVSAGLVLGVVAALRHNRGLDYAAMLVAILGVSVPGFIVGILLQVPLGVWWKLLPVAGWGRAGDPFWAQAKYYILPAFVLGLGTLALVARMMRSSMLDVLGQDYIRTARARGLGAGEIIRRHALRNALLPIITILGPIVVNVTTGSFIIERIFAVPGLGKYFVDSIFNSDYGLILGTTLFYGLLLLVALFLVDLAYGLVDPRIRLLRGRE